MMALWLVHVNDAARMNDTYPPGQVLEDAWTNWVAGLLGGWVAGLRSD